VPPPSAQGSTVSFNGSAIGSLKFWQVTPRTATFEDITTGTSTKLGTGAASRIVQELACLMVAPGSAQLTLWGMPPFSPTSVGSSGTLTITFSTGSVSLPAILEDYGGSGRVGQYIDGTAKFRFTGGT
jgi:hypothetical protein